MNASRYAGDTSFGRYALDARMLGTARSTIRCMHSSIRCTIRLIRLSPPLTETPAAEHPPQSRSLTPNVYSTILHVIYRRHRHLTPGLPLFYYVLHALFLPKSLLERSIQGVCWHYTDATSSCKRKGGEYDNSQPTRINGRGKELTLQTTPKFPPANLSYHHRGGNISYIRSS
jgi:hypothetical protein